MRAIRRLIGRLHFLLLNIYDWFTAKECEASVGDIILKRAEIDYCQFLLTSRKLDVSAFVTGRDKSFPFQNTISRSVYGTEHKEELANHNFTKLIESYKAYGYDPTSRLNVDKECRLIDGNHRMGVNLYMGIERMNVRFLRHSSPFSRNLDAYFKIGLSSSFLEEVYNEFYYIQKWLIETGNTFCCILMGETKKKDIALVNDLKMMANVLNVQSIRESDNRWGGVLIQFSLDFPCYCVKDGILFSRRAEEIERLLILRKKQFGLEVDIQVSKNCIEGKEFWNSVNNIISH